MKGVKHVGESMRRTREMQQQMSNKRGFASGGRVKAYGMDAGACSGEGRLEKVEKYGSHAKRK